MRGARHELSQRTHVEQGRSTSAVLIGQRVQRWTRSTPTATARATTRERWKSYRRGIRDGNFGMPWTVDVMPRRLSRTRAEGMPPAQALDEGSIWHRHFGNEGAVVLHLANVYLPHLPVDFSPTEFTAVELAQGRLSPHKLYKRCLDKFP